jgi:hypothetical protein
MRTLGRGLALSCAGLMLVLAAASAQATLLGTDASGELTGSRDVDSGGGLKGFNDWDNGLFTVAWEVTVGPTSAHYKYTFSGLSSKDISNIVLDVTDDCGTDPLCATNVMIDGVTAGVFAEFGDFAGITGGLKIEGIDGTEDVMYEFDSNRGPVYGHLAVKDGGGPETCMAPGSSNIVCSNQLLGIGDPDVATHFVVVPDGVIPEPGTGMLVCLGLGWLGAYSRRDR